jgi:CHAT domain-containing protein
MLLSGGAVDLIARARGRQIGESAIFRPSEGVMPIHLPSDSPSLAMGTIYCRPIIYFVEGDGLLQAVWARLARIPWALLLLYFAAAALLGCDAIEVRAPEGPREEWSHISQRIERPIRGRLSSGSRYRGCAAPSETCGPLPAPTSTEFTEAARLLARLAHEADFDAEALHADALARIALGGARSLAVLRRLEAAAALAPDDPHIASDLLAVRLTRAGAEQVDGRRPWIDARQAFEAVSEAVDLVETTAEDPTVWFNYALVFEAVGLPNTAREGWTRFLALEPEGSWADEARRQLDGQVVFEKPATPPPPDDVATLEGWAEAHPLEARTYLERTLLSAWCSDPSSPAGVKSLRLARVVAEVVERRFGDSTIAETVQLLSSTGFSRQPQWSAGLQRYYEGLDAYTKQRFTDALEAFTAAHQRLTGLPFQGWASYRIAVSLYGLDRYEEAGVVLRDMKVDIDEQELLESRRLWLLALVEGSQGHLRESVQLTEQALAILLGHPDLPAVASMHANLAAPLDQLSQQDRAWYHRLGSLRASAELGDYRIRHIALHDTATRLIALGEAEAALPFLTELSMNAAAWDVAREVPTARLEAALLHAAGLSVSGQHQEAGRRLGDAVQAAGRLEDPNRIERLNADIALERAEVLLARNEASRALDELDAALVTYTRFGYRYPLVRLHRLRGEAASRLGHRAQVAESYREAVATHEEVLASLEEPDDRAGYLAHAGAAYDSLLRHLAVDAADADGAFSVLDASRRVWAPQVKRRDVSLRDLQSRLSADSALVAFRVLDRETIMWWISSSERTLIVRSGGRAEIAADIERHEAEMAFGSAVPSPGSATAKLYQRLFEPLEERLAGIRRLVIMPDRLVHRVAFEALVDPTSGQRLLDSFSAISVVASASQGAAPRRPPSHTGIVAVGDPAFDRASFSGLDRLPHAGEEAAGVAAMYPGSTALVGAAARPARVEEELRARRALHYAGHALFDPDHPERSGLLLAPGPGEDGLLTLTELDRESLTGLDLVFLSACRTSGGDRPASQDWAEALLSAGVGGVVASRWEVEDDQARSFALRFHELRKNGLRDDEALLATKRAFSEQPPRHWAGFVYYGWID